MNITNLEGGERYHVTPDCEICVDVELDQGSVYLSPDDLIRLLAHLLTEKERKAERDKF